MGITRDLVEADRTIPANLTRNKIINGGFDIWQRGDTFSSGDEYTADRWRADLGTLSERVRGGGFYGKDNHIRVLNPTGLSVIRTSVGLEGASLKTLGKEFTISFFANIPPGEEIQLSYSFRDMVGSSVNNVFISSSPNLVGIGTWKQYTHSFTITSSPNSTNISFEVAFTAQSNNMQYDLATVQLEEGNRATPFEQRHIGHELALCQRYYEKKSTYMLVGQANSGNGVRGNLDYNVKRADPTISTYSLGEFNDNIRSISINSLAFSTISKDDCRYDATMANSNLSNNSICYGTFGVEIDAEL